MGIEPTSRAWEARVIATIRRPLKPLILSYTPSVLTHTISPLIRGYFRPKVDIYVIVNSLAQRYLCMVINMHYNSFLRGYSSE